MIKSKLGSGMVVSDKYVLDKLLQEAVVVNGNEYTDIFEYVVATILDGEYSSALKSHALQRSGWFKKYIYEYTKTH